MDEAGQKTYTVVLNTLPTGDVDRGHQLEQHGRDRVPGETAPPHVHHVDTWSTEQTVTVEGVDHGDSANETVTVTNTASGSEYEGVTASVRVTVDDDDKPGITFTPASLTVGEAGVGNVRREAERRAHDGRDGGDQLQQPGRDGDAEQPTFTVNAHVAGDVNAAEDGDEADVYRRMLRHRSPAATADGSGQNNDLRHRQRGRTTLPAWSSRTSSWTSMRAARTPTP